MFLFTSRSRMHDSDLTDGNGGVAPTFRTRVMYRIKTGIQSLNTQCFVLKRVEKGSTMCNVNHLVHVKL